MTHVVTNTAQFERAWEQVRPGDQIIITVHDKIDFHFKFSEWKEQDKSEWSGCAC